jgi:hypothetical protein
MCDRLLTLLSACLRASKKAKVDAADVAVLVNALEQRDYVTVTTELAKHWVAYDSYDARSKTAIDQIAAGVNLSLE